MTDTDKPTNMSDRRSVTKYKPIPEDPMTADDYQLAAARTCIPRAEFKLTDHEVMVLWDAVGIGGEAGEVVDLVKKQVFHRHGIDRDRLKLELGDLLWYVASLCTHLGLTLEQVMASNVAKLRARYPDGYDPARNTDEAKAKEAACGIA